MVYVRVRFIYYFELVILANQLKSSTSRLRNFGDLHFYTALFMRILQMLVLERFVAIVDVLYLLTITYDFRACSNGCNIVGPTTRNNVEAR